ncbi:MAG: 50S ribosomal protein L29 [Spartobacteria bacterium]|nr:50S ribosomal protein L29 [Spartobacteria bacterium]
MKASELRELTSEELEQRSREVKQEMFNLRLQQISGQVEKPSRIKDLRRAMARIKTIVKERQKVEEVKA